MPEPPPARITGVPGLRPAARSHRSTADASMPEDSGVKLDTEQLIQIKAPQHQRVFHFGLPVSEECRVANRAPVHPAEPMGLPSPEALQVATDVIRRRYVLPETMEHPEVRSECMRLAYLIMAYGLGSEYNRTDTEAAGMSC